MPPEITLVLPTEMIKCPWCHRGQFPVEPGHRAQVWREGTPSSQAPSISVQCRKTVCRKIFKVRIERIEAAA